MRPLASNRCCQSAREVWRGGGKKGRGGGRGEERVGEGGGREGRNFGQMKRGERRLAREGEGYSVEIRGSGPLGGMVGAGRRVQGTVPDMAHLLILQCAEQHHSTSQEPVQSAGHLRRQHPLPHRQNGQKTQCLHLPGTQGFRLEWRQKCIQCKGVSKQFKQRAVPYWMILQ